MSFILRFLMHVGRYGRLIAQMFSKMENPKFYWRECMNQCYELGIKALPIIGLVSIFAGAVAAIQLASQLSNFHLPMFLSIVGRAARDTIFLEISCTFNGIVLAGVIGSKITSELGNMRISDQIDALEIMGVNSKMYLIMPKIFGLCSMAPFLSVLSFAIGIMGAFAGVLLSGLVSAEEMRAGLLNNFKPYYIFFGMLKVTVFCYLLSSISAYFGYTVKGGSIEIGKAATTAVVTSCIFILLFDYLLTLLL